MDDHARRVPRDRDLISTEGERLLALAETRWATPVPTCPGWEVGTALAHVGVAHRWAAANIRAGERVRLSSMPRPPEGRDGTVGWCRESLADLLDAIDTTDPEAPVWTFGRPDGRYAWWWTRRQAQETAIHRWDAEHAVAAAEGRAEVAGFDPEAAAAGIDEYLCDFLPRLPPEGREGLHGTLHLHTTDAPGEWVLDLDDPTVTVRREHAKAATAVRGPATEVLLWLWNRRPATAPVEAFGDESVITGWRRIAI